MGEKKKKEPSEKTFNIPIIDEWALALQLFKAELNKGKEKAEQLFDYIAQEFALREKVLEFLKKCGGFATFEALSREFKLDLITEIIPACFILKEAGNAWFDCRGITLRNPPRPLFLGLPNPPEKEDVLSELWIEAGHGLEKLAEKFGVSPSTMEEFLLSIIKDAPTDISYDSKEKWITNITLLKTRDEAFALFSKVFKIIMKTEVDPDELDEAITLLRQVIKLDPIFMEAYLFIGGIYNGMNNKKEAAKYFSSLYFTIPMTAMFSKYRKDFEESARGIGRLGLVQDLLETFHLPKKMKVDWLDFGFGQVKRKKPSSTRSKPKDDKKDSQKKEPTQVSHPFDEDLVNQAMDLKSSGKFQDAIEFCEKELELNPRNNKLRKLLGELYVEVGEYLKADECFKQVINN